MYQLNKSHFHYFLYQSHVYKGNLYLDLQGYRTTQTRIPPPADGNYGVYALDTESVSTTIIMQTLAVTKKNLIKDENKLASVFARTLPGYM